ncbi:hypothetical protein M885DRAFT_613633 [Pelagophyceae sp. CCMP2097]|nr:hypothetical protein M885DRAFT_613633 [Pelagophyceae sp. CCMP2097]|mmetsp:Transcript_2366/g.8583  ORF Transcript_2366/g.8583 Transcript_2366/m.8583 type:complete len:350 (-) Transcript_2366:26-1075(-)
MGRCVRLAVWSLCVWRTASLAAPVVPALRAPMPLALDVDGTLICGVLHGAPSSIADVDRALFELAPRAVVVELCDARWKSLTENAQRADATTTDEGEDASAAGPPRRLNPLARVAKGSLSAFRQGGPGAGVGALVLGTLYAVVQLVGFAPGEEFLRPLKYADLNEIDVVLGDRPVVDTLAQVSDLSGVTLETTLSGCSALAFAALGGGEGSISIFGAVLGDARLRSDMARLTTAVAALATVFVVGVEVSLPALLPALPTAAGDGQVALGFDVLDVFLGLGGLVLFGRIGAVVIDARDEVLAASILSARTLAAQDADGASVVAIVGALHVNGVAQRLRSESWRASQATSI